MIVDDSMFMRMIIKNMISQDSEYEVVAEASNGSEAVQRYEEFCPDLVTMDITMPEMDGVTALKEILSLDPRAKVIMVSAMGQQSLLVQAIAAGAADFIVKPFDKQRIQDAFEHVLNK
ncbi:response regulator [Paenibacillus sp. GD4]|uniref:response regulator n=1 Tax=Paenibacillus sp. GD4 TaxID=3068890 RepID=UPI00279694B4|nr:response regulator [Paenibacillus sp. GD4]MDQ1909092.1 response regulator [Paenibacillus sp. GD4]